MSRIHLTTRCRRRASVSPASPWLFFLGGEIRRLSNYWKGQSAPPNSFKVEFRISWLLVGHIGWKCWRAITQYSFKVQMISDQFSMVALFLQDEAVKLHGFATRSRPLFARMMTSFTNSRHQPSQAKTRCKASMVWMGVVKFFRVFEGCIYYCSIPNFWEFNLVLEELGFSLRSKWLWSDPWSPDFELGFGEIEFLSFSATAECYRISANEVPGKVHSRSLRTFLSVGLLEPLSELS